MAAMLVYWKRRRAWQEYGEEEAMLGKFRSMPRTMARVLRGSQELARRFRMDGRWHVHDDGATCYDCEHIWPTTDGLGR